MDFDDYQKAATKTALYDPNDTTYVLMYLSMGIAGESGEFVDKIKKLLRDNDGKINIQDISEEKRELLKKELGDVLWYLSQFSRMLDFSFSDVAETNIKKIHDRIERGVIKGEGDTR